MTKITLRKPRETRVRSGHPWLYASEIERVEGESAAGVAEVYSAKGTFLARALYNPASQIALRILTTHDEPIDADFFARRVRTAWVVPPALLRREQLPRHLCRGGFSARAGGGQVRRRAGGAGAFRWAWNCGSAN